MPPAGRFRPPRPPRPPPGVPTAALGAPDAPARPPPPNGAFTLRVVFAKGVGSGEGTSQCNALQTALQELVNLYASGYTALHARALLWDACT